MNKPKVKYIKGSKPDTEKMYLVIHSHEDSKAVVGSKHADVVKWTREL